MLVVRACSRDASGSPGGIVRDAHLGSNCLATMSACVPSCWDVPPLRVITTCAPRLAEESCDLFAASRFTSFSESPEATMLGKRASVPASTPMVRVDNASEAGRCSHSYR